MTTSKIDELPVVERVGWPWTAESTPLPQTMANGAPWPKVTIVTPSYNQAPYLEETIRSVLLQGYPNLEYIIIDGGSTDGSVDIIKEYESWLAYWVSEADEGQSHAINKGFERATGEIIAWLNSDDFYEPDAIAHAAQSLHKHPKWDLIYSDCNLVDGQGNVFGQHYCCDYAWETLLTGQMIPQQTVFVRRVVYETVGGIDESFHYSLDFEWLLRIARHKFHLQRTSGTWANFRLVEGTKSMSSPAIFWDETIPLIEEILTKEQELSPEEKGRIRRHVAYSAGLAHVYDTDGDGKQAARFLQEAFRNEQLPYKSLSYIAEELVGRSRGKARTATTLERKAFLQRFFNLAPKTPLLKELRGFVAMILAFEAYQAANRQETRRFARLALRNSTIARHNGGLWKILIRSFFYKAGKNVYG